MSAENCSLKSQICELREDVDVINQKLNSLENKSLESNLIFRGIEEPFNDTEDTLRDLIYHHIADTFNYQDWQQQDLVQYVNVIDSDNQYLADRIQ